MYKNEFDIVVDVTIDLYRRYLHKSKLVNNVEIIFIINFFQESSAAPKTSLRRFNCQHQFINYSKILTRRD